MGNARSGYPRITSCAWVFAAAAIVLASLAPTGAWANTPGTPTPGGAPESGQKPLEVNGQSRNLNMTLVLRNDKDKIKFVKVRENYRAEILEQTKNNPETHEE